jgi:transposase
VWVPRVAPEISLDAVQRQQLESLTRANSATQTEVLRARIVLLAARDWPNEEIAAELKTTDPSVSKWRRHFAREGLAGLPDASRSGRPARLSADSLNAVLTKVTQPPKGRARWSCRKMAREIGVSKSWVQQLWFRNDLKPH